jgi:hypothetical protein
MALDTMTYSSVADSLTCIGSSRSLIDMGTTPLGVPLAFKFLRLTVTPVGDSIWVKSIWLNALPIK